MAEVPQISVIMPAYNTRRYIGEAVESVLNQTLRDFEFIIIDDGSTDGTTEILQRYASQDNRIRLVTRPNTGYAVALNEALGLARGPLVARMDADDVCLPERFAKQAQFLESHPDHVLVGSRVLLIDSDGSALFEMPGIELEHEKIDHQLMTAGWTLVHPALLMRCDAMNRVGGYQSELVPVEDHDLFLRMAEVGRVANLPDILLKYRKHPVSAVHVYASRREAAMRKIIEASWERRKIPHRNGFPYIGPGKPESDLDRERLWAWMALKAGHVSTARKYAMSALRRSPLSIGSWKLAYCAARGR